jgi:hypothetical protein
MDETIMSMLSTVGVPAAICFYVLTKMQTAIDNNTKAIMALTAKMGGFKDGN